MYVKLLNTLNPSREPGAGRLNLLFAVILIIVGIGVLIILFRASDGKRA